MSEIMSDSRMDLPNQEPTERIIQLSRDAENIRNIAIVGPQGDGKSTLARLFASEYKTSPAVERSTAEQKYNGVTTRLTIASFPITLDNSNTLLRSGQQDVGNAPESEKSTSGELLINLIDCPSHVDFSAESNAAIRVSDSVIVIVDYEKGISVSTAKLIEHAVREAVKPILVINQLDKIFAEGQDLDVDELYNQLDSIVNDFNAAVKRSSDQDVTIFQVDPREHTIVGSEYPL